MAVILIVDDEEGLREFLTDALVSDGHEVTQAQAGPRACGRCTPGPST